MTRAKYLLAKSAVVIGLIVLALIAISERSTVGVIIGVVVFFTTLPFAAKWLSEWRNA